MSLEHKCYGWRADVNTRISAGSGSNDIALALRDTLNKL